MKAAQSPQAWHWPRWTFRMSRVISGRISRNFRFRAWNDGIENPDLTGCRLWEKWRPMLRQITFGLNQLNFFDFLRIMKSNKETRVTISNTFHWLTLTEHSLSVWAALPLCYVYIFRKFLDNNCVFWNSRHDQKTDRIWIFQIDFGWHRRFS